MQRRTLAVLLTLLVAASGCLDLFGRGGSPRDSYEQMGWRGNDETGTSQGDWPDLDGTTLTIVVAGNWTPLSRAVADFEDLTGATVVLEPVATPQEAVDKAVKRGDAPPTVDVVMGLDQAYLSLAAARGGIEPYTPLLAKRADPLAVLPQGNATWLGAPYQHSYVAVLWDPEDEGLQESLERRRAAAAGTPEPLPADQPAIADLFDVREHANRTAIPHPTDTPEGRAFLLTTISFFGEDPSYYDWKAYWRDLLRPPSAPKQGDDPRCIVVGSDALRPITVGPTSDVLEPGATRTGMVLAERQSWHRIDHAAVVLETPRLGAAQAWLEFLLTDAVQNQVHKDGAFPTATGSTLGELDNLPAPGSFRPAFIDLDVLGFKFPQWLGEVQALLEAAETQNAC